MGQAFARRLVLLAGLFLIGGAGACDFLVICSPPPDDSSGICDPNQPTCGGGTADPVPDTRMDGAVDIGDFPPDQIPAGVVLNVPNEGRLHVLETDPLVYATNPPASGPHFEVPAPTGFYCEALTPGNWVHSLEHGYIVVLFDESQATCPGVPETLRLLLLLAPRSEQFGNRKLVITPYDGLQHAVCAVAWNRQVYFDYADLAGILDFYSTYVDMGPEEEE